MEKNKKLSTIILTLAVFFIGTSLVQSVEAQATNVFFSKNLKLGDRNEEVKLLQQYLNSHNFSVAKSGVGSPGYETTYFGPKTRMALMLFQQHFAEDILKPLGLSHPTGNFYTSTRNFINASLSTQPIPPTIDIIIQPQKNKESLNNFQVQPKVSTTVPSNNLVTDPFIPPRSMASGPVTPSASIPSPTPPPIQTYTIGGNVSGLSSSVVLQNNGGNDLTINADGSFTFSTPVGESSAYNVTVLTQPVNQVCIVANGSGTVGSANVTNVAVTCSTNTFTVGGTMFGLSGTIVLSNNSSDATTITTNGSFTFSTPVAEGSSYNVTVGIQPLSQTCTVVNGSGTMGSSNVTNVDVSCALNDTTLSASVSTLGLSVNDTALNPALTGTPRTLTITNTGANPAVNVTYSSSPAMPSGATINPASCGTIIPGDTCVLTITPGSIPSALSGDTNPTPITLSISSTNTNILTPTVNIVTYGSVYNGGYVYSVDDTTPDAGSIGGVVVSLTDQTPVFPNGIIWSSNSSGTYDGGVAIYGISETSTTSSANPNSGQISGQTSCPGNSDGACDTNNIYVYYENSAMGHPINTSSYAAGVCKSTINGYSDWYLPAICEMGPASNGSSCSFGKQNMVNQLPDLIGDPNAGSPGTSCVYGANCLAGDYWSSTEYSSSSQNSAWNQYFASSGSTQANITKNIQLGVRCSRALTL